VLLDIVLKREPFRSAAVHAAKYAVDGKIAGFVSVQSLKDVFYFVSQIRGNEAAFDTIEKLSVLFKPIGVSTDDSLAAIMSEFSDYEDALIDASAVRSGINTILTRDRSGFHESGLLIIHPDNIDDYLDPGVTKDVVVLR
jgi:predicted nucleic acid-binding protein